VSALATVDFQGFVIGGVDVPFLKIGDSGAPLIRKGVKK